MRLIRCSICFFALASGLLLARRPDWSRMQVTAAVDQVLAESGLPRSARLLDASVDGSRIGLNFAPGTTREQALRAALAAVSRLPGDAGAVALSISVNGEAVAVRAASKLSRAAVAPGNEPTGPRVLLRSDSLAAGAADTLQAVLSSQGLAVIESGDAAVTLTLQATAGAAPLVAYSSEVSHDMAAELQAGIPGARLVECSACLADDGAPSVLVELGDSSANASTVMAAALAIRSSLKTLATASSRSAAEGQMVSPVAGSTLGGSTVTFQWDAGSGSTDYWLMVGTWLGGNTIFSADMGTLTTATVTGIPADGRTIYVRLWSYVNGAWVSSDSQFKAAGATSAVKAGITSPTAGTKLSGTTTVFNWSAGSGVSRYYLFVGTWAGGNTLYSGDMGTSQTATVTGLPSDASPIYVRLWSYIDTGWQYNDYAYTASGTAPVAAKATLTTPSPGSKLAGTSVTLAWNAGTNVDRYYLFAGTWQGGNDLYSADMVNSLSAVVTGLPSDASTIFVRLWSYIDNAWQYSDYTYTAVGTAPVPVAAVITSPASGSKLTGATVTFTWSTGTAVDHYYLFVGTTVGNNDVYGADMGTSSTSAAVSGLPTNGKPLYVRIWSYIDGAWQWSDAQYTAAGN